MILADGRDIRLLPVGTEIRHVKYPDLTGRVYAIEMNAPGVASAIPYNIDWDDPVAARETLGLLNMYADVEDVYPTEAAFPPPPEHCGQRWCDICKHPLLPGILITPDGRRHWHCAMNAAKNRGSSQPSGDTK